MKTREQAAEEWVEKYAFRVPYNGTNDFYDKEAVKHGTAGFLAGCEFEAQNRWIPVSERLPERYERVIIDNGVGYIGRDGNWYTITGIECPGRIIQWEVTHWQPFSTIPPKPQEL